MPSCCTTHYNWCCSNLQATKPKPRSIILPRATLPKRTGATPTSLQSTTQLRMLPQPTPPRHRSTTPPRQRSTTPPRHRSTTPPRHRSTTPPGHRSTTPPGHRSTTPPRHRSTTPPRHRSTTPPRHRSTTPPRMMSQSFTPTGPWVSHWKLRWSQLLHWSSKVLLCPELLHH